MSGQVDRKSGLLLTTASSLVWGTVFVSIGYGLDYLNPYELVFMRFLIASIPILFAMLFFEEQLGIIKELKNRTNWTIGLVYAFSFFIQYIGQNLANASDAALLSNLSPIIAPIGAFFFLKDKLSTGQKIALPLGFAGLVLVTGPKLSLGGSDFIGDMLLIATSGTVATFIILSKKMNIATLGASFSLILILAVYLAPVGIAGGLNLSTLTTLGLGGWASIIWTAIPCTLISIALYLRGLSGITVSESAILLLLQVITGLFLAYIIFGEGLGPLGVVGAGALSVAVLLSSLRLSTGDKKRSSRKVKTRDLRGRDLSTEE